ncbi:MAG: hypothetical protein A2Y73_00110 [Chloroflexi bacterium RBG_13_56_8]|nr:MAG: hypothetical protein A2Y73_00110 [Chloroflexi bacterium RBG_13_56_8]
MLKRCSVVMVLVSILLSLLLMGILVVGVVAQEATYHTIQWGESLLSIARKYGVTVSQLVEANGLTNANLIYAGQRLLIPESPQGYVEHVVVQGESLLTIAAKYGVRVTDIAIRNNILNLNLIYPGQRLIIPGAEEGEVVVPEPTPSPSVLEVQEAIVIVSPVAGDEVSSSFVVTGWGSGFENSLAVNVLDEAGVVLGQGYVVVDAEFGQYGPFEGTIEFNPPATTQIGRIQVFSVSPRDGAIEHLASVTVTLKS